MIRTQYQVVPASEATTELTPGPLTRPISIAGTIYVFDPGANWWARTGLDVSDETNWVATTSGLYAIEGGIATDLFISEKTASVHVSNILAKLGLRNRAELAARVGSVVVRGSPDDMGATDA